MQHTGYLYAKNTMKRLLLNLKTAVMRYVCLSVRQQVTRLINQKNRPPVLCILWVGHR